jgi:hypothetical protein
MMRINLESLRNSINSTTGENVRLEINSRQDLPKNPLVLSMFSKEKETWSSTLNDEDYSGSPLIRICRFIFEEKGRFLRDGGAA